MRTKIIAGNWKMNKTPAETKSLIGDLRETLGDGPWTAEVVVCPPFVSLPSAAAALEGCKIGLGAQNLHAAASGAYTGEVSAAMLVETGVKYVIVGHSERRTLCGETDKEVQAKVQMALAAGLLPIVCVGETLAEREAGETDAVLVRQIEGGLSNLAGDKLRLCVVAYEPVWAIGTGRTATPAQAQEAHALIRRTLAGLASGQVANAMRIQYGGSMKPENAAELLSQPDIDGGLIGGAALKAESFAAIVKAAL